MRKLVTSVAAAAVVVAGGVGAWLALRDQPQAAAAVHTAAVSRGNLTVTASASGSIVAINQRALSFGTSGTVSKLNVKPGDQVTAGQILARLDDSDAQNAVDAAAQALDAAKENLALAQQQADEAAQATAAPSPSATGRGGGPGGTSGGTGGGSAGSGGTSGGGSSRTTSSGTDNLLRAQQSVNNAELTLEQDESKLDGTTIVAPVAGRILSVSGAVGSSASAGGSGFILMAGASDVAVQAEFSEADVAAIKIGQKAGVTLANHAGTSYPATVTQIDPAGTASGQLVRFGVELTFSSVPAGLLLGQSADVVVTTASASDVLYVPAAAVTTGADGKPQVMVRVGSTEQARPVTVGLQADQGVQIMSGLDAGQTVVVS